MLNLPTVVHEQHPQQQSALFRLNDRELVHILLDAEPLFNCLTVCKKLYSTISIVLHQEVCLSTTRQLASFCAHLCREPSCAKLVGYLVLDAKYGVPSWVTARGGLCASQLGYWRRLGRVVPSPPAYTPSRFGPGPGLVQDLLRALPTLTSLTITNQAIAASILTRAYLETSPIPTVTSLFVSPFTPPLEDMRGLLATLEGEPDNPFAAPFLGNLVLLPHLETLTVAHSFLDFPLDVLNLSPDVALSARSLNLREAYIDQAFLVTGEIRNLASALRVGLTAFTLDVGTAHTDVVDVLLRLPPSLERLVVRVGSIPCGTSSCTFSLSRKIDGPALDFPHLTSLELKGDIVSPPAFIAMRRLSHLEHLTLGEHVQYSLASLLSLLPSPASSPPNTSTSRLRRLTLDICSSASLESPADEERGANWPCELGPADARELLRAAEVSGVVVGGTVRRAAKACGDRAGHICPEWFTG